MSALSVLCNGVLWRDAAMRTSKATGKTFVTGLIKSGTPTEPVWANVVAFDEAAKNELLRLKAGESLSVQGPMRVDVFEKNGVHRPSLDITANHVLGLRQPKPTRSQNPTTSKQPAQPTTVSSPPTQYAFNDDFPEGFGG